MPEMIKSKVRLVVGSDSLIGNALMAYWLRIGENVIGTTRNHDKVDEAHIYLNLEDDISSWECPYKVDVAVICAGITKVEACMHRPEETRFVNVVSIVRLIEKLLSNGTFIVYLSSSQIFDGSKPWRLSDEPVSPITEYGKQKAEVERRISLLGKSLSIVRISKVLGPSYSLFSQWIKALRSGEEIQPFSDMSFSPLPLSCVTTVLHLVGDLQLHGILQISGAYDISYAEAALIGADVAGCDKSLIKPINAHFSNKFDGAVPLYTSFNIDRLRETFGIEPPDVRWTVRNTFMKNL